MPISPHIKVEGLKELQAAIRRAEGKLPKAIGEAHKEVGRFVIGKIPEGNPHAVGKGAGAKVRPSATKRDVLLRVGGAHRTHAPEQPWGKRLVQPLASGRPYIVGTVLKHQREIEHKFMSETIGAVGPAFYSAK